MKYTDHRPRLVVRWQTEVNIPFNIEIQFPSECGESREQNVLKSNATAEETFHFVQMYQQQGSSAIVGEMQQFM